MKHKGIDIKLLQEIVPEAIKESGKREKKPW